MHARYTTFGEPIHRMRIYVTNVYDHKVGYDVLDAFGCEKYPRDMHALVINSPATVNTVPSFRTTG